jgi:ribonuclease J
MVIKWGTNQIEGRLKKMENVKIFALGGLDENGKNMYVIEVEQDIFIFECGLKYPSTSSQLGVEKVIPDFSYLVKNKDRVKAIFITHGHVDVMGALTDLIKVVDADIYATPLTTFMIKNMFKDEKMKLPKIHNINRNSSFKIGNMDFKTFGVTQSIPDSYGIAMSTKFGDIVYTSEFIVDYDVYGNNSDFDIYNVVEIGKKGVLALLTESIGSMKKGYTSPNHKLLPYIESDFEDEKRIFITLYYQNVYHVMEVLDLAQKHNKKVYIKDAKLKELLNEIDKLGYYSINKNIFISDDEFNNDMTNIIIIIAGIGKKVVEHMHKIATGESSTFDLKESDTVILATPALPGTEKISTKMENDLYKEVDKVIKIGRKEVYSMHASMEDIKMMINLLKPKYFIPVKGEYRHLVANANIATDMGYKPNEIIILDNGQVAKFNNGHLVSTKENFDLNDNLIDGKSKLDDTGMVIRDREILSTDGVIIVGVVLDFYTKEIVGGPDVQSRGVIYLKDADYIVKEIGDIMTKTIVDSVANKSYTNMDARFNARDKMIKYINKETNKRPMVLTSIVEIR